MQTLFYNIKEIVGTHNPLQALRGVALSHLPNITNGYLLCNNGLITEVGSCTSEAFASANASATATNVTNIQKIDCTGQTLLPCWADSHTHLVYAGSREDEFVQKLQGDTYAQIAASGGGILSTARQVQVATEEVLLTQAYSRLQQVIAQGTGAIEIKSGYGLTIQDELKMLRVIAALKAISPIPIVATCLAAHAIPLAYKHNSQGYVELLIKELLPQVAQQKLAAFIDVFCDTGFYTVAQLLQLIIAAKNYGIQAKIHTNQLSSIGGLQAAIAHGALSVDHLETMTEDDIVTIGKSNTIGTLLPTAAYFLRMQQAPAWDMLEANAALALASDYNPGSSPSGNMNIVVSMACITLKMLPAEAVNAATINGAFAMGLQHKVGSIAAGKLANFILTKPIPNINYLPYSFGSNHIHSVYINGQLFKKNS